MDFRLFLGKEEEFVKSKLMITKFYRDSNVTRILNCLLNRFSDNQSKPYFNKRSIFKFLQLSSNFTALKKVYLKDKSITKILFNNKNKDMKKLKLRCNFIALFYIYTHSERMLNLFLF